MDRNESKPVFKGQEAATLDSICQTKVIMMTRLHLSSKSFYNSARGEIVTMTTGQIYDGHVQTRGLI